MIFPLTLQIYNIKMTKKIVFVFKFGVFFFFLIDDLTLNGKTFILGVDMNANVSIEAHMTYDKPFILTEKVINIPI
jgi:hypothetical protein